MSGCMAISNVPHLSLQSFRSITDYNTPEKLNRPTRAEKVSIGSNFWVIGPLLFLSRASLDQFFAGKTINDIVPVGYSDRLR